MPRNQHGKWLWRGGDDVAGDDRTRSLKLATLRSCPYNHNEEVEENSNQGSADDNGYDGGIDLPKITRDCTTKKQQGGLQHQRRRSDYTVKGPCDNAVQFPLLVLVAAFNG